MHVADAAECPFCLVMTTIELACKNGSKTRVHAICHLNRLTSTFWTLQVRAFLELKDFLLGLDLPPDTRQAWERFL